MGHPPRWWGHEPMYELKLVPLKRDGAFVYWPARVGGAGEFVFGK